MQRARARVKEIMAGRRRLREPIEAIVAEVNRYLRGWGVYSRAGNSTKQLRQMDRYVHASRGLFASKQTKRSGRGWRRNKALLAGLGISQLHGNGGKHGAAPIG